MNAGGMPKTCKSNEETQLIQKLASVDDGFSLSGARVSNAWVIYLRDWNNKWTRLLIPDYM